MKRQSVTAAVNPARGWWRVRTERQFPDVLRKASGGARVTVERNQVIGSPGDGTALVAEPGDFWFHTDGVFLSVPPRWVFILVLEADTGGAMQVLDTASWLSRLPSAAFWFGRAGKGIAASLCSRAGDVSLIRYRRDYMEQLPGGVGPDVVHGIVQEEAEQHAVTVGELRPGTGLLLDNWRMLHRRTAFCGRRVIRRVWLGEG